MERIERATIIGTTRIHEAAAPPQGDGRPLTLAERAAILHGEAVRLQTTGDPTEVKFALKSLIADAQKMLRDVNDGIDRQRRIERAAMIL